MEDIRDLEKFLVDLLKGVDALLEIYVVGWELSLGLMASISGHVAIREVEIDYLVFRSTELLFDILLSPSCERREG